MRLFAFLVLVGLCPTLVINAQNDVPSSTYIHCTEFSVSKPMRDLPDYKPAPGAVRKEAADEKRYRTRPKRNPTQKNLQEDYTDPLVQTSYGAIAGSHAPLVNFEGTADSIWDPGDPNGAVNDSYYVQTVNITYTVFNKTGGVVLHAKDLGSLWSGDPEDGDPVVLYDKFADRWFLSEFQVSSSPCQFCVAVSKTNDPTGAYYVWKFNMGNTYPDYPKYSIWSDGYYVTFQAFSFSTGNPITPQKVAVLERNRMLKGDANAGLIIANLPSPPVFLGGNNSLFTAPKILDCDASALPPFGTPDYLVYFENIASGGYSNSIVMYKLVTDTTAKKLTVTRADSFHVPTFNAYFTGGSKNDISQPGDANDVDALDGTFNFRVPYGVFTGYNSVVLSNTVNLGGLIAGIRWYELRQNSTTQVWSIYQNGTYGPNDGISRWNGSICMDEEGNIGLQYCVTSSTVYPGIRYTGRLVTDTLGTMTLAEQTVVNGTSTIFGSSVFHRWGDYSQLDIDPADGLTFWGINQYGGFSNNYTQLNRIFSFKISNSTGINDIQDKYQTNLKVYQNGSYLEVNATGLPDNENLEVDLFDISGRQLTTQSVTPVSTMFETKINVSTLPAGVYFVRIGRVNFQKVVKTIIN